MKKIRATELRIGNVVMIPMFTNNENQIIEKITHDFGYCYCIINSFWLSEAENKCDNWAAKPIELNKNILLKLGFEYAEVSKADADGVYRGDKKLSKEYFVHKELPEKIGYYLPYNSMNVLVANIEIKYLHELQNFWFTFTGNELKCLGF